MPSTFLVLGPNSCCSSYWKLFPGEEQTPPLLEAPCPRGPDVGGPWRRGAGADAAPVAPGPAEGAAASPAGLRGCGARVPACASREARTGSAPPPARARSPPPAPLRPGARRGALRPALRPHPLHPLRRFSLSRGRPGGAAAASVGGFGTRVRATPPSPRSSPCCAQAVPAQNERRARQGVGGRRQGPRRGRPCARTRPRRRRHRLLPASLWPPPTSADLRGRLAGS